MKSYIIIGIIFFTASSSSFSTNISTPERAHKRIITDKVAPMTKFPWLVKIISYDWSVEELKWANICTGTYIHEWWILTAASCVIKYRTKIKPKPYYVVKMFMGFDPEGTSDTQEQIATKFSIYSKYLEQAEGSKRKYSFNLVLVRPEKRFSLNSRIQIDKNFNKKPGSTGNESYVVGFGYGKDGNFPRELLVARMKNFQKDVKHVLNKVKDVYETRISICFGDVGSPLYWGVVQVGVASRYIERESHPEHCGIARYVNIYNKEAYKWLRSVMDNATGRIVLSSSSGAAPNVFNLHNLVGVTLVVIIIKLEIR